MKNLATTIDKERLWKRKRDCSLSALHCIWNRKDARRCVKITGQDLPWLLGLVYEPTVKISTREQWTNQHVFKNSFSNRQPDGIHFNSLGIRHTQCLPVVDYNGTHTQTAKQYKMLLQTHLKCASEWEDRPLLLTDLHSGCTSYLKDVGLSVQPLSF
jgi:hypothetical protein